MQKSHPGARKEVVVFSSVYLPHFQVAVCPAPGTGEWREQGQGISLTASTNGKAVAGRM